MVPDNLTLLSRKQVNNRTSKNGFDTVEANWLSVLPKVGGGSSKLIKFQQHTRSNPEDVKSQLNLPDTSLQGHL